MPNIIHPQNSLVKDSPNIIFMGTPEFSVPILDKLAQSEYKPTAVFCAPDKPVGRKQVLTPPPAKVLAQKYDIPVHQPKNKNELVELLKTVKPDLVISAAFGIILPKAALDLPTKGCINIHPSLLPRWRGASPVQAAILNGDAQTGVTIFKMDEGTDAGAIIAKRQLTIADRRYTTPELTGELAKLGARLLLDTLPDYSAGKIEPKTQNNSQATFSKIITKEDGKINWQKSAKEIKQQIRAFTPWPGAYSTLQNQNIKIKFLKTDISQNSSNREIGEIFLSDDKKLCVQTGNGRLIIKKLQMEGGKALNTPDWLRGHSDIIGQMLR